MNLLKFLKKVFKQLLLRSEVVLRNQSSKKGQYFHTKQNNKSFYKNFEITCSYLAIGLIAFYKVLFSPWMGGCCRYIPSCSDYALEGFKTDSFLRALFHSLKRILRCHPLGSFGYDLYPLNKRRSEEIK